MSSFFLACTYNYTHFRIGRLRLKYRFMHIYYSKQLNFEFDPDITKKEIYIKNVKISYTVILILIQVI